MKTIFHQAILFFTFLFFSYSPTLQAQQSGEHLNREIGLQVSGLNSFGLIYKKHKKENKFRRYRLGLANIAFNSNQNTQAFDLRANIAVGYEKRKAINDKLHFIHGLEFLGGLNISATEDRGSLTLIPGIGFVLGFQYVFSKAFYLSLETVPFVNATFGIDQDGFQDALAINAGFNSRSASINLAYCFESKKEK